MDQQRRQFAKLAAISAAAAETITIDKWYCQNPEMIFSKLRQPQLMEFFFWGTLTPPVVVNDISVQVTNVVIIAPYRVSAY